MPRARESLASAGWLRGDCRTRETLRLPSASRIPRTYAAKYPTPILTTNTWKIFLKSCKFFFPQGKISIFEYSVRDIIAKWSFSKIFVKATYIEFRATNIRSGYTKYDSRLEFRWLGCRWITNGEFLSLRRKESSFRCLIANLRTYCCKFISCASFGKIHEFNNDASSITAKRLRNGI